MNIKVIGSGCENCDKTNAVVKECLEELGMDTEIERATAKKRAKPLQRNLESIRRLKELQIWLRL